MVSISKATEYNWKKLNSCFDNKLTKRANKTLSVKKIVASNYIEYTPANKLLQILPIMSFSTEDIMYSLCIAYLKHIGILQKENVKKFISPFSDYRHVEFELPNGIWDSKEDILGYIYQSLLSEGERNSTGQYYTNRRIVENLISNRILANGETFLDPCCGSGAFLMSVKTNTPECLYGFDINPIAVMIAGVNLLVKYSNHNFKPNVYCLDFLLNDNLFSSNIYNLPLTYDNIYTNPPWGADKQGLYTSNFPTLKTKERSSLVLLKSLEILKENGELGFLLPTSLLKIKTHCNIRKYILSNTAISRISIFTERFDGVFTDFFDLKLKKSKCDTQEYDVSTEEGILHIKLSNIDKSNGNIITEQLTNIDNSIVKKMEALRNDDLKNSLWALGIVTGDNKSKIKKTRNEGLEPIYAGKDISPFKLNKETSYIFYDRNSFQQCAKEEYYRASEKLIYRFIAKYPIVAYDNKQCLCLNSANIVIPRIQGVSIKSTAALLNSKLYRYYYTIKFADIKVLKGNLQELPFPKLSTEENNKLEILVDLISREGYSDEYQHKIDNIVYAIFKITVAEQEQIEIRLK